MRWFPTKPRPKRNVLLLFFSVVFAVFSLTYAWIPSVCFISLLRVPLWVLLFRIISFRLLRSVSVPLEQLFPIFFFFPISLKSTSLLQDLHCISAVTGKSLFVRLNIHTVLTGHCCNRRATAEVKDLGGTRPWREQSVCILGRCSVLTERLGGVWCFCWVTVFHWTLWPEVTFFFESFIYLFFLRENKCSETRQFKCI